MPRNMSFSLTTEQIRNGTKTITRRFGWWNLKPGEIVNACIKCMGLKKGERVEIIRQIRIVSIRTERLCKITKKELIKEGFPKMSPLQFISFFLDSHKSIAGPLIEVNRIEFEYL
jgi:hypothetical protein